MDTNNNHNTTTTHNAGGSSRTLQASPSSSGVKVFEFGCVADAAAQGFTKLTGTFIGTEAELTARFAGCCVAAIKSPEIVDQPGVFEFGIMARKRESIDGQMILSQAETPNLCGSTIPLYFTFDGKFYRVRTSLETLTKTRKRDRAELSFAQARV